jgi:O-antigen/teichoic acid export membrane protein
VGINYTFNLWKKNLAYQWISTLYVAALGFFVSVILARELGVLNFGNYSFVLSLAGIILIIQDGGYRTLIYRESIDGNSKKLVSSAIFHVLLITGFVLLSILLLQPKFWLPILTATSCMSLVVISGFVSSLLKGYGDFKSDAIWKIAIRTFTAVSILLVLFLCKNNTITFLFVGWSIALILVLIWAIAKGYLEWPSYDFKNGFFKASMVFLTIDVATVFYFRSDIVLLEYLGNVEGEVGQYSAAYRILEGIILLATPVAMITFRFLRRNLKNKKKFFHLIWILLIIMFAVSTLIVLLAAFWGIEFMVFIFGTEYSIAGTLLFWLLLAMFFILPNYILTQGAIALNKEKSYAIIVVMIAVVNIILNIELIPNFGAIGAVWSTIVAEGILFLSLGSILWLEKHKVA